MHFVITFVQLKSFDIRGKSSPEYAQNECRDELFMRSFPC